MITALYAWATFRILKANEGVVSAMQVQTEAQLRPYVVAYVSTRVGTTLLRLTVENTGKSAALDLRMVMDKSFIQNGERGGIDISQVPAFCLRHRVLGTWRAASIRVGRRAFNLYRRSRPALSEGVLN